MFDVFLEHPGVYILLSTNLLLYRVISCIIALSAIPDRIFFLIEYLKEKNVLKSSSLKEQRCLVIHITNLCYLILVSLSSYPAVCG